MLLSLSTPTQRLPLVVLVFGSLAWSQNVVSPAPQKQEANPGKSAQTSGEAKKEVLGEIVSDRPDFTESARVVGRGVTQVEYGTTIEHSAGTTSLSSPELLYRWGWTRRLEARFSGEGLHKERERSGRGLRGYTDAEVGAKVALWDEGKRLPGVALIPFLSLPVGHRSISSQAFDPSLKVAWGKDLPADFGLSGNINFTRIGGPEGRVKQWAWSLSLGHALPLGFGGYWEAFRFSRWDVGERAALIGNAGLTHGLGKNAQLDFRFGRKLTVVGPDWFTGFGVVVRRPGPYFINE